MKPKQSRLEAMRGARDNRESPDLQAAKSTAEAAQKKAHLEGQRADSERRHREQFQGFVSSKMGQEVFKIVDRRIAQEITQHIYKAVATAEQDKGAFSFTVPMSLLKFASLPGEYRIDVKDNMLRALQRWARQERQPFDDDFIMEVRRIVREVLENNETARVQPVDALYRRILREFIEDTRYGRAPLNVSTFESAEYAETVLAIDIPRLSYRQAVSTFDLHFRR